MTLQIYEDFESAAEFAGRWSIIESGTGEVSLATSAGWPTRGKTGVSLSVGTSSTAHIQTTLAEASECYMGYWLRITKETMVTAYQWLGTFRSATAYPVMGIRYYPNDNVQLYVYEGASSNWSTATPSGLADGEWHYLKWGYKVGEFGRLWVDDQLVIDLQSNPTGNVGLLRFGPWTPIAMGGELAIDCDELKIGSTLAEVEPYTPAATSDYAEPQRTVILYREGNADSRAFAEFAADALGISSQNLCGLPCSGNLTLLDYATFQAEIETPLKQWLADHPTQAAQTSAFLVGLGIPEAVSEGVNFTATESRLANLDNAFTGPVANPFYGRKTRLTVSELQAAGMYLATRIDGATLAEAQSILNAGLSPIQLAETDKLYTDNASFQESLDCQKLRMETDVLGTLENDGFAFGDIGMPTLGTAGSRAGFVSSLCSSGVSLRITSPLRAALLGGYASAMGLFHLLGSFDIEAYFAVLQGGGTVAEAMLCASDKVDGGAVFVGNPLLTASFVQDGYNVYCCKDGIDMMDWNSPIAYLRKSQNTGVAIPLTVEPSSEYAIAVRAVAGGLETPDYSIIEMETDATGAWVGDKPSKVEYVSAQAKPGGVVRVIWSYRTPTGHQPPTQFNVYAGDSEVITSIAEATVDYAGDVEHAQEITLSEGRKYIGVAARDETTEGEMVVFGPIVVDSTAPNTPSPLIATGW